MTFTLKTMTLAAMGAAAACAIPLHAQAQDVESYLGEIGIFPYAGAWCPNGWMAADGQLLSVTQYSALYSLYGTSFGGDGSNTFALPDLRGRTGLGAGQGQGLPPAIVGDAGGATQVMLTEDNLPAQSLKGTMLASSAAPDTDDPSGAALGTPAGADIYTTGGTAAVSMASGTVTVVSQGGDTPVAIRDPYIVLNYCVSMDGVMPKRGD